MCLRGGGFGPLWWFACVTFLLPPIHINRRTLSTKVVLSVRQLIWIGGSTKVPDHVNPVLFSRCIWNRLVPAPFLMCFERACVP